MNFSNNKIKFQPSLIKVIQIFNENPTKHLSKLDFMPLGVISLAAIIFKLKANGAIFDKITRTEVDDQGNEHKRIACYRLVGWN